MCTVFMPTHSTVLSDLLSVSLVSTVRCRVSVLAGCFTGCFIIIVVRFFLGEKFTLLCGHLTNN